MKYAVFKAFVCPATSLLPLFMSWKEWYTTLPVISYCLHHIEKLTALQASDVTPGRRVCNMWLFVKETTVKHTGSLFVFRWNWKMMQLGYWGKNAVCGGKLLWRVSHPGDPIPLAKYGGGSVMLWGCFSSVGAVKLVKENGRMDGDKYRKLLEGNPLEAAPAEQWPSTHNQSYSETCSHMV